MSGGMSVVTVEEDFTRPPGHAVIRVKRATRSETSPGFRLHRPDWDEAELGPTGWQVAETLLTPSYVGSDGDDLVLGVGPEVCAHVEAGTYRIVVPAAGVEATVYWPEIATHIGRSSVFPDQPRSEPAMTTGMDEQIAPKQDTGAAKPVANPIVHDVPEQATQTPLATGKVTAKAGVPLWALAVLGLLAVAVASVIVAALMGVFHPTEPIAVAPPPPIAALPTTPPPASLDSVPVRDLIARNNPDDMFAQAQQRLSSRPEDALLLLEAAGDDRHHGGALAVLARLYDPNKPRQGGIPDNARQAARYYREAASAGQASVAEDRAALRAWLDRRKQSGDLGAGLTLQDFWP
jgi:TPR repeat protein